MSNKFFSECLSLLFAFTIIVIINGCVSSTESNTSVTETLLIESGNENDLIEIRVTPKKGTTVEDLEGVEGLEISYDGKTLIADVTQEQLERLEENSNILEISKRTFIGGFRQETSLQHQEEIDRVRSELEIVIGPYVEQIVSAELEQRDYAYVGIRFRAEETTQTYQNYIDEINLTISDEIYSIEYLGEGREAFRAIITKDGLNKLEEKEYILEIGLVRDYKVLDNKTKVRCSSGSFC